MAKKPPVQDNFTPSTGKGKHAEAPTKEQNQKHTDAIHSS